MAVRRLITSSACGASEVLGQARLFEDSVRRVTGLAAMVYGEVATAHGAEPDVMIAATAPHEIAAVNA